MIRPTMMRNGTKASKAMLSFTPQSATANVTQSGASGPVSRNGAGSWAQITSSAAEALKRVLSLMTPTGIDSAPLALRPALAVIELISFFVRPLSHSIRLAGNMMAGHAVIKVFAGFAGVLWVAPASIIAITAVYALEMLVTVIQAYVFTILTVVYLNDALHPHH